MSIIRTLGNSNADLADKTNDTEKYYTDFSTAYFDKSKLIIGRKFKYKVIAIETVNITP